MRQGFSLVEMSILLVIFGGLAAASTMLGSKWIEGSEVQTTRTNLKTIEKAITAYIKLNNRLPCPADESVASTSANFGKEAENPGTCAGGTLQGTGATGEVLRGVVPFQTLGMGKNMAYDAWGNRLTYYVDRRMTEDNAVIEYPANNTTVGDIIINDLTGGQRTAKAVYAMVSHGAKSHGALNKQGTVVTSDSPSNSELENADVDASGNSTGVDRVLVQATPSKGFDDLIMYKKRDNLLGAGITVSVKCMAQSISWTVGAFTCDGNIATLEDGDSTPVTDSSGATLGSVTATCDHGEIVQTALVCASATNPCAANGAYSWTVSGKTCTAAIPALTHGATNAATDSTAPLTGATTVTCTNGTLGDSGASCNNQCAGAAVPWLTNCTDTTTTAQHNATELLSDALSLPADQWAGNATATCNDGTWVTSGESCTYTNNDCAGGTQNWTVGGRNCSGNLAALTHGNTGTATDASNGVPPDGIGSASYSCSDGTLTAQAGATCGQSQCAAATQNWTVGASSCSASNGTLNHGDAPVVDDTTPRDTGSVTLTCTNGSIAQSGATCTTAACSVGSADSLRFRGAANYMNKTFAAAPTGARRTYTVSVWVKRGLLGGGGLQHIFSGGFNGANDWSGLHFTTTDELGFQDYVSNVSYYNKTVAKFRDVSKWYHIVLTHDTTNAVASERIRIYVDGVRQAMTGTMPPQNFLSYFMHTGSPSYIGTWQAGAPFYGYMDKVIAVDGQALDSTAFGEFDSNNIWIPKTYAGTYGTNGFKLEFDNATSTATLGNDTSGNSHNWTVNGFSLAADGTKDSVADQPGVNYATWNPIDANLVTSSNGNLTANTPATSNQIRATIGMSTGKYYWEVTPTSANGQAVCPGIVSEKGPNTLWLGWDIYGWCYNGNTGQIFNNTANTAFSVGFTQNDVIGIAFDADTGKLWFAKNGTWGASGNPAAGTSPARTLPTGEVYFPALGDSSNGSATTSNVNFGQQPFVYTPPSGFNALSASNLPTPSIMKSSEHFNVVTYRGNGGGQQIGQVARDASSYQLNRSVRFREAVSAHFSRTPAVAGNRRTWTWSGWIKRGSIPNGSTPFEQQIKCLVDADPPAPGQDGLCIRGGGYGAEVLSINLENTSGGYINTTRSFKDSSRWMHIVMAVDTTQATASNRIKLWVDGVQETSFSTATYPPLNYETNINNTRLQKIGSQSDTPNQYDFDGYMADIHFIDGQQLTPSAFGEFDTKGHWQPKAYSGTYGTNGYRLDFNDNAPMADLGKDVSGNNNHWTANNFSVTADHTNDSLFDVPTSWDDAGTGGDATLSPTDNSGITLAANNLTITGSGGAGDFAVRGTVPITGKAYYEYTVGASVAGIGGITAGVVLHDYNLSDTNQHNGQPQVWAINMNGNTSHSSYAAYGAAYAAGDILMVAVDKPAGKIWFGKNGTWYGGGNPATGVNATFSDILASDIIKPYFYEGSFAVVASGTFNFGASAFAHTPPTGFSGLNSGGNGRGNFPTINPLDQRGHGPTVSGGNLDFNIGRDVYVYTNTNVPQTGKWYWEVDMQTAGYDALCGVSHNSWAGGSGPYTQGGGTNYVYPIDASWINPPAGAPYMADGTCGIAVDMDNDKMWVSINGQWFFGGNPVTGANALNRLTGNGWSLKGKSFVPAVGNLSPIGAPSNTIGSFNFGQRPFSYGPPTGFRAMNSQTMGTSTAFAGRPDFVWLKSRNAATNHALYDSLRDIKKDLVTNNSGAETTQQGGVVQFNDDGAVIGDLAKINTKPVVNYNQQNNVGWMWNEDPAAGFDIVQYTGTNAALTVPHNLGKAPKMILIKNTTVGQPWIVYHGETHATSPETYFTMLDSTFARTLAGDAWGNAKPTSAHFTIGTGNDLTTNLINLAGSQHIAYVFAEIPGFSKFGSYIGNGAADGPFAYTGFKPRWVMIKETSAAGGNWQIYDTERTPFNTTDNRLDPNTATAEFTGTDYLDMLSNGFKPRVANLDINVAGRTYIYAAFAEQPFVASGSSASSSCGCSLPWGGSIASGGSVNAYSVASVTCGNSCPAPVSRTCTNGTLSGSGDYASCSVAACLGCGAGTANWTVGANSCSAGVGVLAHGANSTATDAAAPNVGSATVTCNNGAYNYSGTSCAPANCTGTPWGTINHGSSVTAWNTTASCGGCASQTRTCTNGTLSGTYTATACNNASCASCGLPWGGSIAHGASVTAYASASVPCGSSCSSQTRTCSNGTLSGSYTASSCSVAACAPDSCSALSFSDGACDGGGVASWGGTDPNSCRALCASVAAGNCCWHWPDGSCVKHDGGYIPLAPGWNGAWTGPCTDGN